MSTSATLIDFRLKSLTDRTTEKILIHIIYVKNANYLGIVQNSDRLAKTFQQTSRLHPIQTTSVCKTEQYVSMLFFEILAYIRMN